MIELNEEEEPKDRRTFCVTLTLEIRGFCSVEDFMREINMFNESNKGLMIIKNVHCEEKEG